MASPHHCLIRISRVALFIAVGMGWFALAAVSQTGQSNASTPSQPVLVELFTSEGCSDCPPADALLAQLDTQQPIHGAEAIVLSEHVTYWNHLGWRDPFSFDAMDERQKSYMRQFALDSVYTPQIVVDGEEQLLGSDAAALTRAVTKSAAMLKFALTIADAHRAADGSVVFTVRAAPGAKGTLVAALAENATRSEVARGENAGRTLHHVAVVRILKDFGSGAADGRPLELSGANLINAEKDGEPLRIVVFLANRWSGHVIAVTEQTLGK
jgi:hypothetical protein